ncbi:HNH endonuclease signature motif containing protein [Deinococcus phoenicis]|uniref:HNH endonuclease signature motif containing protein n=1 Tax=Deinococcus phoenicis TaxID=1476583 RepID=UPI0009DEE4D2|nr:HNH endonuclease signature motif containing protein [Deinococcus phoenicis]
MPKKPSLEDVKARFMSKTVVVGDCWIWQGSKLPKGYGVFFVPKAFRSKDAQSMTAHRAAYMLFKGELPENSTVCHRCDNPSCVNPEHLFLGDNAANMRDCAAKGRVNTAKLSPLDVVEIRNSQESTTALARHFGVSGATISAVKRGVTHVELGGEVVETLRKVSLDTAEQIRLAEGRQVDIAARFGVSQPTVSAIKRGVFFGERRGKKQHTV